MCRFILVALLVATASAAPALSPVASDGSSEISSSGSLGHVIAAASSAPSSASVSTSPVARPHVPFVKAATTISEIRTPASTAKLAHLVAPVAVPVPSPYAAAPIPSSLQISPYAYAIPTLGGLELASAPSAYSIEQHGYHIIY